MTQDPRVAVRFSAIDSWFFRESRPHNAVGAAELSSQFPPPIRTLVGALRTFIGEQAGIDWLAYKRDGSEHPLAKVIGHGEDIAPLRIDGPWPVLGDQRLFPAPAFLLKPAGEPRAPLRRLAIGGPVRTDLGWLRLPAFRPEDRGAKPLTGQWITAAGLENVLSGGVPAGRDIKDERDLFAWEPRIGIARDNRRGTVEEQMLYQTRHLRPNPALAIEIGVHGLSPEHRLEHGAVQWLGGEGRLAALESTTTPDSNSQPVLPGAIEDGAHGLILTLLTPADLNGHWLPDGFSRSEDANGIRTWIGEIADIELEIQAAVIGKAGREGGWDMLQGQPRAVRSLVPAGSAWYCKPLGCDLKTAASRLHLQQIGMSDSLPFGRGLVAVGVWPHADNLDQPRDAKERP